MSSYYDPEYNFTFLVDKHNQAFQSHERRCDATCSIGMRKKSLLATPRFELSRSVSGKIRKSEWCCALQGFGAPPNLRQKTLVCRRKQNALITSIEERLEQWTLLPLVHQEDMQILRYAAGQKYGAHYDSLDKDSPRIATVLLYLRATDLDGGETAFPAAEKWIGSGKERGPFSECAEGHVAAKPKKGDALMFYSLKPDGDSDVASLHTGQMSPIPEKIDLHQSGVRGQATRGTLVRGRPKGKHLGITNWCIQFVMILCS